MPSFFMREISVVRLIPMRAAASGGLRTVQCWIGSDCDDNSSDLVARLEEAVSLNDLVEREYTGDCRHERAV